MRFRDDVPGRLSWPFVRTMVERDVVGFHERPRRRAASRRRSCTAAGGPGAPADPRAGAWQPRVVVRLGQLDLHAGNRSGRARAGARCSNPGSRLATAVAVIDALGELGFSELEFGIRWPNDLECAGKKLGGILTRAARAEDGRLPSDRGRAERADQSGRGARPGAGDGDVTGCAQRRDPLETELPARLMAAIYRHFESILCRLVSGDRDLPARWNTLDVLRDLPVRVDVGTHVVLGRGQGIDEEGALCLEDGNGVTRLFGGSVLR